MAHEPYVFISYAGPQAALAQEVKSFLEENNVPAYLDSQDMDNLAREWKEDISTNLDKASTFLLLWSEECKTRQNVLEEVFRADERGIPFVVVALDGSTSSNTTHAITSKPNPIRATKAQFSDCFPEILERTANNDDVLFPALVRYRQLKKFIADPKYRLGYRPHLLSAALEETSQEIDSIHGSYEFNIGVQRNFLRRAKELFSHSNTIYAFSLDKVSTFWTSERYFEASEEYVESQQAVDNVRNTARLFIFSNQESAESYRRQLVSSSTKYKFIYFTSLDYFKKKIVPIICKAGHQNDSDTLRQFFQSKDFGFLQHREDQQWYCPTLSLDSLQIDLDDPNSAFPFSRENVDKYFRNLMSCLPGEMSGKGHAIRWSDEFSNGKEYSEKISELFPAEMPGKWRHIVVVRTKIRQNHRAALTVASKIKLWLLELKEEDASHAPVETWFGTRKVLDVKDPRYKGRMCTSSNLSEDEEQHIIIMEFESKEKLLEYYNDVEHSKKREEFFKQLNVTVGDLYDVAEANETRAATIYDAIEERVKDVFARFDFESVERYP